MLAWLCSAGHQRRHRRRAGRRRRHDRRLRPGAAGQLAARRRPLAPAPSTRAGCSLGGTPFRVWRLNERAAARRRPRCWAATGRRGRRRPGARPPPARRRHGPPGPRRAGGWPSSTRSTVVIPFLGPAEELAAHPGGARADRPGDRGRRRVARHRGGPRRPPRRPAPGSSATPRTGARRRPATPGGGWPSPTLVAFVDAGCLPVAGWLAALLAHLDDPPGRGGGPADHGRGAGHAAPASSPPTSGPGRRSTAGPRAGCGPPRSRVPFVPVGRAARAAVRPRGGRRLRRGPALGRGRRPGVAAGRGRAARSATSRPPRSATSPAPPPRAWLRQRFGYGSVGGRRWPGATTRRSRPLGTSVPVRRGVGARAPASGVVPGVAVRRGHHGRAGRRSSRPCPEPRREAAAARRLLGHAYGGRAVADALRRPWWPLARRSPACGRRRARRRRRGRRRRAAGGRVAARSARRSIPCAGPPCGWSTTSPTAPGCGPAASAERSLRRLRPGAGCAGPRRT